LLQQYVGVNVVVLMAFASCIVRHYAYVSVVDTAHLPRDTAAVAANLLDCLVILGNVSTEVICFSIASKLNSFNIFFFEGLASSVETVLVSAHNIITMERCVLRDMNWLVFPPTPMTFVHAFVAMENHELPIEALKWLYSIANCLA
jgi:hypothetical protein